jgi:hypothetical protein
MYHLRFIILRVGVRLSPLVLILLMAHHASPK